MYIQIEIFMYAITSDKKQRTKYKTEMLSRTHNYCKNSDSGQKVKLRAELITSKVSSKKNNLTLDSDEQTFNRDNAEGH